jgi:trans-2,3-dihydro-3-hydroxyanthranilate isomerase
MSLSYLQYDVFTSDPLTGNQLAVFLDARGVQPARMQAIAREMNFSESTFILPSETPGTDVRMRIFTPGTELPMAGHPTIGSTFALADAGVISRNASRFVFGLGTGPTPVDLEWNGRALRFAWMTQLNPVFAPALDDRRGAASALGLTVQDLVPDLPVQQVSCGVPYLLVPLRDRATVDRAEIDLAAYRAFVASNGLAADMCLYLFAISAAGAPDTVYSRMFAPAFGIAEDPATGSAAGPLGCYLVRHGAVSAQAARHMRNLQGVVMGRPSCIHMSIAAGRGDITQVRVGGEAVLVARGELLV